MDMRICSYERERVCVCVCQEIGNLEERWWWVPPVAAAGREVI
jgi:hypothetical protein